MICVPNTDLEVEAATGSLFQLLIITANILTIQGISLPIRTYPFYYYKTYVYLYDLNISTVVCNKIYVGVYINVPFRLHYYVYKNNVRLNICINIIIET